MTINEYKELCSRLKSSFPQSYPNDYLNKCWAIWKDIDASLLRDVVDKSISRAAPECLSISGMHAKNKSKVHNYATPDVKVNETSPTMASDAATHIPNNDALDDLKRKHKAESAWDLVKLKINP